jgi:hypothetical protein
MLVCVGLYVLAWWALILCNGCGLYRETVRTVKVWGDVGRDWHEGGSNNVARAAARLLQDTNRRSEDFWSMVTRIGQKVLLVLGVAAAFFSEELKRRVKRWRHRGRRRR